MPTTKPPGSFGHDLLSDAAVSATALSAELRIVFS